MKRKLFTKPQHIYDNSFSLTRIKSLAKLILYIFILVLLIQETSEQIPNCDAESWVGWAVRPGVGASSSICTACSAGFNPYIANTVTDYITLVSYELVRCNNCTSNCLSCNASPSGCLSCHSGTYLFGTVCQPCTNFNLNCATCHTTACQSCTSGFVLNPANNCVIDCITIYGAGCATCTSSTCQSCLSGYARNTTSAVSACVLCMGLSNCQTCVTGPICTACDSSFYLDFANSSMSCVSCSFANCAACENGPSCISCNANFALDTTIPVPVCVACSAISNCISCKNGPSCVECIPNHAPNDTSPWNHCAACGPTEYQLNNKCVSCPQYCTACFQRITGGVICTSCQTIATINPANQLCKKCDTAINKCTKCSDLDTCTECSLPNIFGSSNLCDQCQQGFTFVDGFCTNVIGCQIFSQDQSQCIACFSNFNFVYQPTTKKCLCNHGYYASNSSGFTQCLSKCGDGIWISGDEDCDDGNLRNEDGCSASCRQESNFSCTSQSPSRCTLQYSPAKFEFNYAYRFEGQNRCKFSLLLIPSHSGLKYVNWQKYLSLNISDDIIAKNSKIISYIESLSELSIQFQYLSSIENLKIELKLSPIQPNTTQVKSSLVESNSPQTDKQSVSVGQSSTSMFTDLKLADPITMTVNLNGANAKLIYEDKSILKAYQSASTASLVITILILLQFVIGSYFHKMIGIETVQILQFFYFVRIIIQQNSSTFLNSMNMFKYVAYGGYSHYQTIYGQQSKISEALSYMTVKENFVQVGLIKYFSNNVNISLIFPAIVLIVFIFNLSRKYFKRNQYFKSLDQSVKDQYTVVRRSCQWIYDHFVFPYLSIFNMVIFFSIILYLQTLQTKSYELENSPVIKLIETTSFAAHLAVTFLTFFIFCSQVFISWEEFQHSQLSDKEKARVPKSIYQRLDHDENNPDRANYKPGYVLVYLIFYLLVEIVLMLDVLLPSLKDFGLQIMLILSVGYLILVWKWKPYHEAANFHNKALILNHLVVFVFMAVSVVSQRLEMNIVIYVVLIYIILLLLVIVALCGYMRIAVEYRFRKKLLQSSSFMDNYSKRRMGKNFNKNIQHDDKKQALLRHNRFSFDNIMKKWLLRNENFEPKDLTQNQVNRVKEQIRKELYEANRKAKQSQQRSYFPRQLFQVDTFSKKQQNSASQVSKEIKYSKEKNRQAIKAQLQQKPVSKRQNDHENLAETYEKRKQKPGKL